MKRECFKKFLRTIFLGLSVAGIPLAGWATTVSDDAAAPAPTTVTRAVPRLSGPAHEVVKMTASGVPEETIKAYVESTPATFNLTPDNIINLQGVGVSSAVMTDMLMHDKTLRDNASAYAATAMPQPPAVMPTAPYPTNPQPVDNGYATATADEPDYYNGLTPYGNWNYLTGYGWCWQPYSWLGYNAYPWGLLGFGSWCNWPGRGWCWFPNSRFNHFDRFNRFDHFNHVNNFNRFSGFAGNRFQRGFSPVRSVGFSHSFGVNRSVSGFHGFSPAMGHFSGGHFGGGHSGGGGGFHR